MTMPCRSYPGNLSSGLYRFYGSHPRQHDPDYTDHESIFSGRFYDYKVEIDHLSDAGSAIPGSTVLLRFFESQKEEDALLQ